jgi:hypothetical protein
MYCNECSISYFADVSLDENNTEEAKTSFNKMNCKYPTSIDLEVILGIF